MLGCLYHKRHSLGQVKPGTLRQLCNLEKRKRGEGLCKLFLNHSAVLLLDFIPCECVCLTQIARIFWHNEWQLQCLHSPHSNNLILQLSLCKNPIKCVWNSVKSKAPSSLKANIKYSCGQKCPLTPSSLFSTSLITCKWTVGSCWDHQPLSPPLPTGSGDLYKPLSLPSGCRRPLPRRLAAAGPKLWWHTGEKLRGGKRSIKETMCFTIITCLALSPPLSITHGSLPQKPCSAFLEVSQGTHLNRDALICLRVTYGLSDWGAAGKHWFLLLPKIADSWGSWGIYWSPRSVWRRTQSNNIVAAFCCQRPGFLVLTSVLNDSIIKTIF